MIDTHCHLTFPEFADRVSETLHAAAQAGVTGVITISTTPGDAQAALRIARAHDRVWSSAGIHPLYSDKGPFDWDLLRSIAGDERCVGWGELGLDKHYAEPTLALQREVLDRQLDLIAQERASGRVIKPVVIHCREAFDELVPLLGRSGIPGEAFVFHCFTGTAADMRLLLDLGACVSFTGVLTYTNAAEVREAARLVPAGRVMVETDAPFLPPEPVRKKRPCVPAYVRHTAEALAAARGMTFEAMHDELNETTARFFGVR
ncbi:MAG: TatD family hydrolase [Phycisphaerales bacterium]|nr:TatD family hydrolase [Phycisphaeraceae bacterium]